MKGIRGDLNFQIGPRRLFPLFRQGRKVNIGLIEIGCRPDSKRAQLLEKYSQFTKLWNTEFTQYGINWTPQIRRTLLHYNPEKEKKGVLDSLKKYNPDVVIFYSRITDEDIANLTAGQVKRMCEASNNKRRKVLKDIIKRCSGNDLQDLIINEKKDIRKSGIRGKAGEMIGLNRMQNYLPNGMHMVRNGDLEYLRKELKKGQEEVDGVLVHYDPTQYWELIKNFQTCTELSVSVNWDIQTPDWIKKQDSL